MVLKSLGWLLVPALGLTELLAHFYFSSRPPNLEEWRGAKPALAALRKHEELVVVAPDWAGPNARYAFGDALMPLADVARADESAYARAIEVSIIGADAPELSGWRVVEERRSGKFRLRVVENPAPAKVSYDFVDHVADAVVRDISPQGHEEACHWNPQARRDAGGLHGDPAFPSARHECPGGEWHFVGATVVEDEKWRGRRCLWSEPSGNLLSIRFHDVPVGNVVRGYATLPWWIERELRGAPVQMEILVGGDVALEYVHKDGDGWKPFTAKTGTHAGSRTDVEFRIWSHRPRDRQFCFQADTR
jgi:hypothetical protein